VNAALVKRFCEVNSRHMGTAPGYAVVLTFLGEVEDAIGVWKKLEAAVSQGGRQVNPLFVDEASFTLRKLKDSSQLAQHLKWLLARDPTPPQRAISALLSLNHDPLVVNSFLAQNGLMDYRMRYYCFIVCHTSRAKGAAVAMDTLGFLLDVLSEIDDESFDAKRLDFTAAAQDRACESAVEVLAAAKREITETALHVLEVHGDTIDGRAALAHVAEHVDKCITLAIHRVKRQYAEGLQLLRQNDRFMLDGVQEFCRAAPEPPAAFSAFLGLLDPDRVIREYTQFIEQNLPWMNLTELMRFIPSAARIKGITPILRTAFNLLMQRRMSLDTQIAMTESMLVDSRYRRTVLQADARTVDRSAKCAACGKAIAFDVHCFTPPSVYQAIACCAEDMCNVNVTRSSMAPLLLSGTHRPRPPRLRCAYTVAGCDPVAPSSGPDVF